MPKRYPEFFVVDILVSIETVNHYMLSVQDPVAFVQDEVVFKIVTRELEIIGEATSNLLKADSLSNLVKPAWRRVVDFRNVISHEYFGLDFEEIFDIATRKLPVFEREIKELVHKLKGSSVLHQAISETKQELQRIGRNRSVVYLEDFEKTL